MATVEHEAVRWQSYAAGTEIEHFAWWCSEYLVQSVDRFAGEPLVLEPWQLEFMGEALATRDALGAPYWSSNVLIVARKNGKTALLAAYALWRLLNDDGEPEILLAAASDKQAGRLFKAVVSYVRRNPELAKQVHLREYVGEIARADGGGMLYRLANDPTTLHGYNPSLVIVDELHAWTKPSHKEAWVALTTAGGAREKTQVFTITTAGDAQQRESSILGAMLDKNEQRGDLDAPVDGLTISRNHPARTLIYNYSAPTTDPRDIAAMRLANPASWITDAYLKREAENPELTDAQVLQLHGCVWAAGSESWLPAGAWRECAARVDVADGAEVVLGFDGSDRRDSTALVACTVTEKPHVFVVDCWERPEGAREEWRIPREEVKVSVDEAMRRWNVRYLVCDPPGWYAEIDEWGERYPDSFTLMYPTNRRRTMSEACSRFYSAVLEKGMSHDGDERLARHLANAVTKETTDGRYITKDHPDSPRKIDLAVAAVMAHDYAVKAGETTESFVIFA